VVHGCVWERVSGYIINTAGETNRNKYGASVIAAAAKYKTIYSAASNESSITDGTGDTDTTPDNEKRQANYDANSVTTRYGDAVLETSTVGYGRDSWNGDYSRFPSADGPFFMRGGGCGADEGAGVFAFHDAGGLATVNSSFRVALVSTL